MPDINGIQLVDKLSTYKQTLPTIIITGNTDLIGGIKLSFLGVCAVLEKPFKDANELSTAIKKALRMDY